MENQAPTSNYHRIFILGGHALAVNYALSLAEGRRTGEIAFHELFCVTDDPKTKAYSALDSNQVIAKDPARFILEYAASKSPAGDTLVPDHTAKHVMLEAFMQMAREKRPDLTAELTPFKSDFTTPFLYKGENDALWAVSHATWTCPPDCDEPDICPHLQAERDWNFFESLPKLLAKLPTDEFAAYRFGCAPLYREISQIPLVQILKSLESFAERLVSVPPRKVIVATHSRCHGIMGTFKLG